MTRRKPGFKHFPLTLADAAKTEIGPFHDQRTSFASPSVRLELAKLIEHYKGIQFRADDGTWRKLSLKTAEDWAQLDVGRMQRLAEVREHVSDSYRYYLRAIAAETERQNRVRSRIARANGIIDGWGAMLPTRIYNEELGDYTEDMMRRAAEGQRALVWLRVVTAILYTGVNAIGYVLKAIGKRTAVQ
jgi:hypothetical protein